MSMVSIVNASDSVAFYMREVLKQLEEVKKSRLTKKQQKALQAIESYAISSKEDAETINTKAMALVESALGSAESVKLKPNEISFDVLMECVKYVDVVGYVLSFDGDVKNFKSTSEIVPYVEGELGYKVVHL